MLKFDQPKIEDLQFKAWLVTNGIGGYASSTIFGMNTRRYHGLLVASFNSPTDRQVLVSKIEESIAEKRDCVIEFSSNQYSEVYHPKGWQYLKQFERLPAPKDGF